MKNHEDPVDVFKLHATGLRSEPAPRRLELLRIYVDRMGKALDGGRALLNAWIAEEELLGPGAPETKGAFAFERDRDGQEDAGLRAYLNRRKRPSVKRACMAAVYYLGPLAAGQVLEAMKRADYRFGKGDPGGQVRSGLWVCRRSGELVAREDGRQEFANERVRQEFAKQEGLA